MAKDEKGSVSFSESAANLMATFVQLSGKSAKLNKVFIDKLDGHLKTDEEREYLWNLIEKMRSHFDISKEGQKRRKRSPNKGDPPAD